MNQDIKAIFEFPGGTPTKDDLDRYAGVVVSGEIHLVDFHGMLF